uniref:Gamma-aminobutyric acid type B receptor subunit 2 n=1 Tax=Aceria tosichella TaxID=561515 RepID=A0A6G1S9V3_9ACAR
MIYLKRTTNTTTKASSRPMSYIYFMPIFLVFVITSLLSSKQLTKAEPNYFDLLDANDENSIFDLPKESLALSSNENFISLDEDDQQQQQQQQQQPETAFSIGVATSATAAMTTSEGQTLARTTNQVQEQLPYQQQQQYRRPSSGKQKLQTLYIAGLFPLTGTGGWIGGSGCLPAAEMALDDVNARQDLLPGYKLELTYKDSQCNPGKAARFMYDLIYHPPKKIILVCGCSTVCSIVAESANMWNLIVVGYGSSSPALSDRSRFPTFFRTHPSATIHNPTRIRLFEKYGWSRIAIILETEEVFIETARDLEQRCRARNIQLLTRVSFVRQPADAMDNLKRADPRIIVGMFYKQQARRVMCEAYKRGLYGEKYVWFLIGWYEDDWWTDVKDLECTSDQMKAAVEGHLTTEGLVLNQDNRLTVSGYTSKDWLRRYQIELSRRDQLKAKANMATSLANNVLANNFATTTDSSSSRPQIIGDNFKPAFEKNLTNSNLLATPAATQLIGPGTSSSSAKQTNATTTRPEGYQEAPLAYDAIWAIALALNNTIQDLDRLNLSVNQFNYTRTPQIKDVFLNNLRQTNFLGISGEVAFSDIGDRIARTQIEQMTDGNYSVIGYFDTRTNKLDFNESRIRWPRGEPPKDRTIIMELVQYLSLPAMLSVLIISVLGIVASACLIYFNWTRRADNLIRMSHPPSNNIMLLGCIVCLLSVILFGLDGRFISPQKFYLICDLRAWCLNLGFSLFFGSMFWKVWQSYILSTRASPIPLTAVTAKGGPLQQQQQQQQLAILQQQQLQQQQAMATSGQVFVMVGSFCLIDIIVLTLWKIQEPMDRTTVKIKEQSGPELNMGDDVIVELKIEYCQANLFWYYLIFCYKGLLLVFGLFLAYETRGVKLRHLNDSKLVGMCIYNVAIMCFITGPISLVNLMRQQANYHYLFVSITIIFCCSLSMILIFMPKVIEYYRRRKRGRGTGNSGSMSHNIQDERSSRDDEEHLHKLERERNELAEKIREKDSQMKAMIARIEEARENANRNLGRHHQSQLGLGYETTTGSSLRGRRGVI